MKHLGVGIIGTGNIAGTGHAPAIALVDGLALVAVLSRSEAGGRAFLQAHDARDGTAHITLKSFVADPRIDLVIVCSPDRLHAEQATACLEAGKHVLLEKPFATDSEDARRLVELAKNKGLTLATGFHLRSHAGHRLLRDKIIQENVIGTVRHIRAIWAFPQADDSNWRAKAEFTKWWSLSAVGSHCLDLARWFANDMNNWQQLQAVVSNELWHGPHDETAVVAGQLANGVTVEMVSSVQFGPYNRLEIFGDQGAALCDDTLGRAGAGTITLNGELLDFNPVNPFAAQLQNVLDAIQQAAPLNAPAEVGLRGVQDLLTIGRK